MILLLSGIGLNSFGSTMIYYSIVIYYMSALTIGLATAGTLIGVGLVYYGLKGDAGTGAGAGAGTGVGSGAGVDTDTGYSPYAPTTYDNLGEPGQQVYGGRGRSKSKRSKSKRSKRTAVSRRLRRSKR